MAKRERPPLSHAQQRVWFLHQLDPSGTGYHLLFVRRLRGELDVEALRRALEGIVHRHASLRTTFPAPGGQPYQHVLPPARYELVAEDELDANRILAGEARRPFDLATEPPLRTRLLRLGPGEHVFIVAMHHIATDGWSMGVFWTELRALYAAGVTGKPATLPALPLDYIGHAEWERTWLAGAGVAAGQDLASQLAFWKQRLGGSPEETALPYKGPRPPRQTFRAGRVTLVVDSDRSAAVQRLARSQRATLFMTLLATLRALLARYAGQEDLVIGTPVANRFRPEIEGVIGMFANTVALRNQVRGDESFAALLAREKTLAVTAYEHQTTPFDVIVDALAVPRTLSRTPLFQVMYNHAGAISSPADLGPGIAMERGESPGAAPFDLTVTSVDHSGRIELIWVYNEDLFERTMIEQLARHFVVLLEAVTRAPLDKLATLPLLTEAERERVLVAWNDTALELPAEQTIPALFARQVARTPDAIAVEDDRDRLSYRALAERARRVAGWLASRGVGRGGRVAIACERSADMVAAVLGVLEAGAAYVPIDPAYPPERRAFVREDSGATIELDDATLRDALASPALGSVLGADPADLAYVLYTSGSTGTPKGVMVQHRAVVNLLASLTRAPSMTAADTLVSVTTLSFDIAGAELFLPIVTGARVVIASRDTARDGRLLAKLLETSGATFMQATPATWRMLLLAGWNPSPGLRMVCTGESLPPDLAAALSRGGELWNMYGPTETTIFSTGTKVEHGRPITIGTPIANTRVYVLDAALQPVPVGVPGELWIGGAGVALGYLGRPDLTAEKFVPDPFSPEADARMYRTGDRARWSADGTLEHLGRLDFQVKVRGHRIELGEIEAVLRRHDLVGVAVVREDTPGDARLVAYVVQQDPPLEVSQLRALVAAALPDYMVPSAFVVLDALPLTPNLKVDRKALPAPDFSTAAAEYVAPTNPVEVAIARIWEDVLGVARAGLHDDFFALGGHSLVAMRMISQVRDALGVDVPVREIFAAPTLAGFARATSARLDSSGPGFADSLAEVLGEDVPGDRLVRAVVAEEYFWYLERADPDPDAYAMQIAAHLEGPLDREALQRSAESVVARHSIFRTAFREVDGRLFQYISPDVPRFELEVRDAPLPEADWPAEIDRGVAELSARMNLTTGHRVSGRLVAFAPERHALILVMHHGVGDGVSLAALRTEIVGRYHAQRSGARANDAAPIQFTSYAAAVERFARTAAGRARADWWRANLRGARPLTLPVDHPRAEHDARRAAAPLGITPDRMHYPYFRRELPAGARANVIRVAREAHSSPYAVYLAGLAWMFHQLTGDDDFCIENTYSERALHRGFDAIQGPLTTWMITRIDTSGCGSLRDVIDRTTHVVGAATEHGVISDYYQIVPHALRRAIFNYVPVARRLSAQPTDLRIVPQPRPFPIWKRPWELHLTMLDLEHSSQLFWTGSEELFRRETVAAWLERYLEILEHEL